MRLNLIRSVICEKESGFNPPGMRSVVLFCMFNPSSVISNRENAVLVAVLRCDRFITVLPGFIDTSD
jgi:hypothetical protein